MIAVWEKPQQRLNWAEKRHWKSHTHGEKSKCAVWGYHVWDHMLLDKKCMMRLRLIWGLVSIASLVNHKCLHAFILEHSDSAIILHSYSTDCWGHHRMVVSPKHLLPKASASFFLYIKMQMNICSGNSFNQYSFRDQSISTWSEDCKHRQEACSTLSVFGLVGDGGLVGNSQCSQSFLVASVPSKHLLSFSMGSHGPS